MEPRVVERHVSPDGLLVLSVLDYDGDIAIGFEGQSWHTHPEVLACYGGLAEQEAVQAFVGDVISGRRLLAVSRVGGEIRCVWPAENPVAEFKYKPAEEAIEFRYWDAPCREWS